MCVATGAGSRYDLVWSAACAPDSTGVLHSDAVHHLDARSASQRPNFSAKAVAEAVVLFDRLAVGTAAAGLAQQPAEPQSPRALGELSVPVKPGVVQ